MSKPVYNLFEEFCDMLKVTNDFQILKHKAWEMVCAAKEEGSLMQGLTNSCQMEEAIQAGDGTLHGAVDYWQNRALKAESKLKFEWTEDQAIRILEGNVGWLFYREG